MQNAITYLRVSTQRQGRSGLGIEAQREAVARFASAQGFRLIAEHCHDQRAYQGGPGS